MIEDPRNDSALTTLAEDFARSRVSRRHFLARAAALGVGASAAAGLLAAATPRLTWRKTKSRSWVVVSPGATTAT